MIGINIGIACATTFGIALSIRISGGHINPAVTVAFLVLGAIRPLKAIAYIVAQILGAFVGAFLTFLVCNDAINVFDGGVHHVEGKVATAHIFASYPNAYLGCFNGLFEQIVGTFIFVLIIVHTVDRRNGYPMWVRPFIMGLGFLMIGTAFAMNTTGYTFNPARDFGPRFFTLIAGWGVKTFSFNHYKWFWIPILGPLIGGVLGGLFYLLSFGFPAIEEEREDNAAHKIKSINEKILTHPSDDEHITFNCFKN